ncbi:MAG: hypothetical protein QOH96_692, partial [Blastocatellia bacterium]|nr:hypothetical protein [Blastocatellia bacterium]
LRIAGEELIEQGWKNKKRKED